MPDAITQIATRLVYENRWLRLREDRVRRLDGSEGIYSVLERADFAVVCPVQAGRVFLVEQFRYPVGERAWEFPMGTWEWRADVDPMALGAGELREETGLIAGKLIQIGEVFQAAGYSSRRGRPGGGGAGYAAGQLHHRRGGSDDPRRRDPGCHYHRCLRPGPAARPVVTRHGRRRSTNCIEGPVSPMDKDCRGLAFFAASR